MYIAHVVALRKLVYEIMSHKTEANMPQVYRMPSAEIGILYMRRALLKYGTF